MIIGRQPGNKKQKDKRKKNKIGNKKDGRLEKKYRLEMPNKKLKTANEKSILLLEYTYITP